MGGMNRRQFAALLPAAVAVAGCRSGSRAPSLLQIPGAQWAMTTVDSAITELESNVSRFEREDCLDVTADVEASAAQVRGAFDNLKRVLGAQTETASADGRGEVTM